MRRWRHYFRFGVRPRLTLDRGFWRIWFWNESRRLRGKPYVVKPTDEDVERARRIARERGWMRDDGTFIWDGASDA